MNPLTGNQVFEFHSNQFSVLTALEREARRQLCGTSLSSPRGVGGNVTTSLFHSCKYISDWFLTI